MRKSILLLALAVSGCSFFSHTQSKIFALDPVAPAGAPVTLRGLPAGIDVVQLPPGFDRREIVVRKANQQLEVRSAELWQDSLQPLVLNTLALDLAKRLPDGMAILPGAAKPAAMRSIDVAFEELAAGPDNKIVLDARWTLREPGRPDVAGHERISLDIDSLDSAKIAAGTSQALAALADRIVAQLR